MKIVRLTLAIAATLLVILRHDGWAQSGEIRGRVLSAATGRPPITGATIEVTTAGATTPWRATSTATGAFRVTGLRPASYKVLIRALGFVPRVFDASVISASAPQLDLGDVILTVLPFELKAVVVTQDRQAAQFNPDRNTYVIRDMTTTRGGTALDVLRNVPSVDVDIDNIVSLRGNSGVTIQINGRPSPMKPAQLGNYLGQLPASIVDKVEVIPNPSARDDPTGTAGIINIQLKEEADAGTSGGITVGAGTTKHADVGANAGYQGGPWSLYGSYGFLRDDRPRRDSIYRENTFASPMTFLEERGRRTQVPLSHTLTGNATLKPGNHDEVSTDLMYSTRNEESTYLITYTDLDASRAVTGMSQRFTSGTGHESSLESALAWKHSFAARGHRLSSELNFTHDAEGGPNTISQNQLTTSGQLGPRTSLETQNAQEHPTESYLRLDYVRPIRKGLRVETGYKGSLARFRVTQDATLFDTTTQTFRPDSSRISDFTYDEDIHAGYGMVISTVGKIVMQGGLRAERATTQFFVNTASGRYDNDYNSLFPSALVSYNVDEMHTVKASYSKRIRRPDDTDLLDPTVRFQDPLNLSHGNPALQPEYIHSFELGFQRNTDGITTQLTPYFRHTLDAIRQIRTIDNAGVTTRSPTNVATADAYGADFNIAFSGGRLGGFAGGSAFRQVSNAGNLGPGYSAKTFGWTAQTNASFRASRTVDFQSIVSYRGATHVEQGRNASQLRVNFAGRKKLMDDRLAVTLRVIDPFNSSRERSFTTASSFYQVTDRQRLIRGLLLTANWMFGRPTEEQPLDASPPP